MSDHNPLYGSYSGQLRYDSSIPLTFHARSAMFAFLCNIGVITLANIPSIIATRRYVYSDKFIGQINNFVTLLLYSFM